MVLHMTDENVNGWIPRMTVRIDAEEIRKCKSVVEFQCAVNSWMELLNLKSGNLGWVTPALLCALKMWLPVCDGHFLMGIRAYNPCCMLYEIAYKPHNGEKRVYPVLEDGCVCVPQMEITIPAPEST